MAAARESMKQAGRLSGAGRLAEAEQQYAEALRHNPRYLEALGILGRDTRRHPWNASGY